MVWYPSSFEPNLNFASELREDLKTKYFELHENAKKSMEGFYGYFENICLEHQNLLHQSIEQLITIEKLRKIIENQESKQHVAAIVELPSSEILGASPNCKLQNLSKLSVSNSNRTDSFIKSPSLIQKENINDLPPIYSEDFNSDYEDDSFMSHKSPPVSVVNSPVKIQSSPILSKRKKASSKRSNSSVNTSSQSIDSNNDSKVSSANASSLEKNIDIDPDLSKEFEKEYTNEPLKPIENILPSPLHIKQDKSTVQKVLNVSKTNYAKTEISDRGRKSKQTMLNFKKVAPILDISKVELDDSLGNQSMSMIKRGNSWDDTYYDKSIMNKNSNSILDNMKKFNSPRNNVRETKTSNKPSTSAQEDDCIEVSFVQHEKSSKLRSKLNLTKKSDISKEKSNKSSNEKLSFPTSNNNYKRQKLSFKSKTPEEKYEKRVNLEANEYQRSISDETYFSQGELTNYKNGVASFEVDLTEFENEEKQCKKPAAKKRTFDDSFDMVPNRREKSPDYAYKEGPVRKKSEKERLQGWDCRECEEYYKDLPEEERQTRLNNCSRHRGKFKPQPPETPPSFWNPEINSDSQDSSLYDK